MALARSDKDAHLYRGSAWRPAELPTAQNVHVQMFDRLTRGLTAVHDQAKALGVSGVGGHAPSRLQKVTAERNFVQVGQIRDVRPRHDQSMQRCLRVQIAEANGVIVSVDDLCRDVACDDPAEQAIGHGRRIAT